MRMKFSNVLWGLFFIIIGLGFAGSAFGFWDFSLLFDGWWTLFIIVPCAISLFQNGFRISSVIGLFIGVMLLFDCNGWVSGDVLRKLFIPFIFVLIGFSMIFRNLLRGEHGNNHIQYQGGDVEYSAVFSGNKYQVTGEKFFGTKVSAIFGGFDLDLRNAIIDEDVVIDATAVFGGIDIYVPSNVRVKVSNIPIFGGVSNKSLSSMDPNAPTIYINSTCMFGGIDIK